MSDSVSQLVVQSMGQSVSQVFTQSVSDRAGG